MFLLRAGSRLPHPLRHNTAFLRGYSSSQIPADLDSMLATPSWSVRSLLPDGNSQQSTPSITPEKLYHLLRLSALPQPSSAEEEQSMLRTLESQIHFVKEMQQVDTAGVEPLRIIRDETPAAVKQATIGLDQLRDALAKEQISGRQKRIKRTQSKKNEHPDGPTWDGNALGSASKTKGRYFVVETGNN